jgi:glycosyltransferase involved in cell wall biosynthesis
MKPSVSVVMSVYNGADHLVKSVESILVQEGVDFEFIIVNDGSTDESGKILEEFARRDNRIHVIEQENTGLTKALIRGCKEARGKYIVRQDVDDVSITGRLKALENILDCNKDMVLAFSWTNCIAPDGEIIRRINTSDDIEETTRKLREEMTGVPAHGSVMFRKDAYNQVGGYNKDFYYAQDCDLWLRMAWEGKIGCVKEYLYNLCLSPESISSSRRGIQGQFTRLARDCYLARKLNKPESTILERVSVLRQHAIRNKANSATSRDIATTYFLIASGLEEQNNYHKAAHFYLKAIKSYPFHFRAWRGLTFNVIKRLTSL